MLDPTALQESYDNYASKMGALPPSDQTCTAGQIMAR